VEGFVKLGKRIQCLIPKSRARKDCQSYNRYEMSRPLESFEFLNRGRDVRLLEGESLRSVFVVLLLDLFMIGMLASMTVYEAVHLHRFDWSRLLLLLVFILSALRYTPVVYRRLGR
jgi:hypothetical protein